MNLKYGITQWSLPGHGAYAVKYAAEAGLDGLQIELGSHEDGYYMAQKKVQEDYIRDASQYGIEFPSLVLNCVSTHGYVGDESSEDYLIAMESLDLSLKVARDMKIGMIMIPQFWGNEIKDDRTFENAVKVLKNFCGKAETLGLQVASETTLSADKQIELMEAIDRPNISTFYDSQNYYFFKGYNQKETIEKLYPYMCNQIHVKDGPGQENQGGILSGALLGQGDSDFNATTDALKKNKYNGWIILENYYYIKSFRDLGIGQFEVIKKDLDYLKKVFR